MGRTGSRSFVSDILVVWGSALFLLATVTPFLILSKWMPPDPYGMPRIIDFLQADFYSFKVDYDVNIHPWSTSFSDYWFHSGSWLHAHSVSPVPHILVAIFVLQISTPVLGFITLPMKPRTRFIPLISCTVAAFLMTWLYLTLYTDGMYQRWSLASGYWLTYASILCFSMSIIFARVKCRNGSYERAPTCPR